jgi:hypothetical protein
VCTPRKIRVCLNCSSICFRFGASRHGRKSLVCCVTLWARRRGAWSCRRHSCLTAQPLWRGNAVAAAQRLTSRCSVDPAAFPRRSAAPNGGAWPRMRFAHVEADRNWAVIRLGCAAVPSASPPSHRGRTGSHSNRQSEGSSKVGDNADNERFDLQPHLVGQLVELLLRREDWEELFAVAADPSIWEVRAGSTITCGPSHRS